MCRRIAVVILLFLFSMTAQAAKSVAAKTHLFTIVIDAGHGGRDTGAIGKNGLREKDIVLSIARKLAAKLETIQGVQAYIRKYADR